MRELWNRDFVCCPFCGSNETYMVSEMKTNPETDFWEEVGEVICCSERRLIDKAWNFNHELSKVLKTLDHPKCVSVCRYQGNSFTKEELSRVIDTNGVEFTFENPAILIEKDKEHKVERLHIAQQGDGEQSVDVTLNSIIQLNFDDETSELEIFLERENS